MNDDEGSGELTAGQVPDPDLFAGYTLVRAGHALERRFEAALAAVSLTARQFGVLTYLAREPGLGSGELARRALVTPQSMGDLIASLERSGYVAREPGRGRGHRIGVRLTDAGWQILAEAFPVVVRFEQETMTGLDAAERTRLNAALHRVLRNAANLGGGSSRDEA